MNVILKESCLVHPAEPTWEGRMPLTEPDQIGDLTHISAIYVYRPSNDWLTEEGSIVSTGLKTSLSKALVHFYPLAGRLCWLDGSRLEIDCNGKGAQLIEASCDVKLDDLGDFIFSSDAHRALIPKVDYLRPIEEIPLVIAQVIKFACGGIVLIYLVSHAVVDGRSAFHFLREWARIARGQQLCSIPFLDRTVLRPRELFSGPTHCYQHNLLFEPPPLLLGQLSTESESQKESVTAVLKLSKIRVEAIKKEANKRTLPHENGNYIRGYTRYESIAAHIWRCASKARRHIHEQPTNMGFYVDARKRTQPPLPENFFSNAIIETITSSSSGEMVTGPLSHAASRVREAIDKVTSEYVDTFITYLKNMKDLSRLQYIPRAIKTTNQNTFFGNPNLAVISWIQFPLHGLDFGWGNEILMAPGLANVSDGVLLIMPGPDEDGTLVVIICLQAECMEDFKNYFYHDIKLN